ncbi:MAG: hypothetical protein HN846_05095 [Candidatus Pacebacteria bacterium]|jgi:hypothetical protein|nr:hypothetical protein [Candidatus Paceibacterota bacterium]MBT3512047.1 hypothetical protein [Candidatus Paceibacterota bacterium]MBT4004477.1 hypothetical protein [Candidatus Paceibacterota bacterium]MBT4359078.1 hypothetical protein [Candidatus Paceibacterota bacterium]MBT4681373.1 hypothetical protein [Candidatus Paceibacterota bacterium]
MAYVNQKKEVQLENDEEVAVAEDDFGMTVEPGNIITEEECLPETPQEVADSIEEACINDLGT